MKKRYLIFCSAILLILATNAVWGQLAPERAAWSNLDKEQWSKAKAQLNKALRKDSANLTANYVYAWYFFSRGNPDFNIDSASAQTNKCLRLWQTLNKKEKDKALRFPFDSIKLADLRVYIDSAAFDRAKEKNTEEAYEFFIKHFQSSKELPRVYELQQAAAYLQALKENTYQSFALFLKKYPESTRKEDAQMHYERLLFEAKTKDKRLSSFQNFVRDYPQSPFREVALSEIFELSTASADPKTFEDFIRTYPTSKASNKARSYLYHLYAGKPSMTNELMTDSLRQIKSLFKKPWWPVWKDNKYGFIDQDGNEQLMNVSDTLDQDILCEGIVQDVFLIGDKLIARNGTTLAQGVASFKDVGNGFLSLQLLNGEKKLLHKSGYSSFAGDATLIGSCFILKKERENSTIYTLTGRKLVAGTWEEVKSFGETVAFKTEQGWQLVTQQTLGNAVHGTPPIFIKYFDVAKPWGQNFIYVSQGKRAGLLDKNLQEVIKIDEQIIDEAFGVTLIKRSEGIQVFDETKKLSETYTAVDISNDWILVKNRTVQKLIYRSTSQTLLFDSLRFLGNAVIGLKGDSTFIISKHRVKTYLKVLAIDLLTAKNYEAFFIQLTDRKVIVSSESDEKFIWVGDKIECMAPYLFAIYKRDRKTVVDESGKPVTLTDFEDFGITSKRDISILNKKKFGLFNFKTGKIIKPVYERNLISYNDNFVVAFKNGFYGFIDWNDKPLHKQTFEEVRYWNDSAALVKFDFAWRILLLTDFSYKPGKITTYSSFENSWGEQLAIFKQDNFYGVMSSKNGIVLEPTYTAILNLGTNDEPFYFTEKYVEEAAVYIVIYYNAQGKQVRRQIFEEADYHHIFCED